MTTMTPIKCFRKRELEFYTEDHAGIRQLVCVAANEMQLEWLAATMIAYHHAPVFNWKDNDIK